MTSINNDQDTSDEASSSQHEDSSEDEFQPQSSKKTKLLSLDSSSESLQEDYVCSFCILKFSSKQNLRRHSKLCSKNPKCVTKCVNCPHCGKSFTRKDNLSVHMKKCSPHHSHNEDCGEGANITSAAALSPETSQRCVCDFCDKSFAYTKDLKRHKVNCSQNSNCEITSNMFECPGCKRKFSRKDNLSVHMKKCSVPSQDPEQAALSRSTVKDYPCSYCCKRFSSMGNARRHKKVCSKNTASNNSSLQCPFCSQSFSRKDNLSTHLKKCSSGGNGEPKKKMVSCLFDSCDFISFTKTVLIDHLRLKHDHTTVPMQSIDFKSEAEFQTWKETEEARTYSYFSQDCGVKGNRLYLYCQHDGSDRRHRKKGSEGRKTSRKVRIGQIKRGKVCLSKMVVDSNEDGTRRVEYYESHSHPMSKHDLAHQPISLSTGTFINNQLAFKVPPREIFKTLQSVTSTRENREISTTTARNLTITERRIRQRAARKRSSLRLHQSDAVSVRMLYASLQQEKYNPVVIYKPMGENVVLGPKENFDQKLFRDLFMFGLQTKEQRRLLVQYSSRVVIVDDTHNVTQYENVKLFNILIVDENNKGWPVGHLISNCMAAKILKLFVHAIKIRCEEAGEVLSMNCIMSDDDPALINGIEEGMSEKIRHILCQFHLDNTFKDAIRSKAPRDMFDTIYTELKVIITEKNIETFLTLFNAFLESHSEDALDFVKYLEDYYSRRPEKWAMCHREGLGHGNINTTGHVESFHNRLKTGEFKRIPNKRMDDLINTLLALETRDFQERERLDILGFSEPSYKCKEKHDGYGNA